MYAHVPPIEEDDSDIDLIAQACVDSEASVIPEAHDEGHTSSKGGFLEPIGG